MKVSIIVPNYNHAKFLNERLESIFNQTYQDFEVIILDDASTDESLEILDLYRDHEKVAHFVVNSKNSGSPFKQWQIGLELAKGDYVWIAETDDFAEHHFLEETVKIIEADNEIVYVYSDSKIINSNNDANRNWKDHKNQFFKTNRWSDNHVVDGTLEVLDYLLYKATVNNISAVLFRKSLLADSELMNALKGYKNAGDLFTYMYLGMQGKIGYVSAALNNYREHSSNITKKNMKSGIVFLERINCYSNILDVLLINKISTNFKQKLNKACRFIIKKNTFSLLDFGYHNNLNLFIKKLYTCKVFNAVEVNYYMVLFKMYMSKNPKIKGLSKRAIKYMSKV